MIDRHRITQLRDEIGTEEFHEVVQMFLQESDDAIARLKKASRADEIEENLHFLMGSALNLGFDRFAEICQACEAEARRGCYEAIDMNVIFNGYSVSREEFQDYLAAQPFR